MSIVPLRHFSLKKQSGFTLLELLDALKTILDSDLAPIFSEARQGDIRHSWAENALAREFLEFSPAVSLQEGLERLIRSEG